MGGPKGRRVKCVHCKVAQHHDIDNRAALRGAEVKCTNRRCKRRFVVQAELRHSSTRVYTLGEWERLQKDRAK